MTCTACYSDLKGRCTDIQNLCIFNTIISVRHGPVTFSCSSLSVDTRRLQAQRTRTELGRRTFSVTVPTVWNSLPAQLRLSGSLPTFKKHLKSLLFTSAF